MSDEGSESGHDPDDGDENGNDHPEGTDPTEQNAAEGPSEKPDTTQEGEADGPPRDQNATEQDEGGRETEATEPDAFDNPLEEVDVDDEGFATPLGGGGTDGPDGAGSGEPENTDDFDNPLEDVGSGDGAVDDFDDMFTEMAVPDVDEETVWEELAVDTDGTETEAERILDGDATDEDIVGEPAEGDEETVVPKTRYCHRCKYFSAPPEVACTHPGTDIVEVVDLEQFRVRNCPVVERRQGPAQELLSEDS